MGSALTRRGARCPTPGSSFEVNALDDTSQVPAVVRSEYEPWQMVEMFNATWVTYPREKPIHQVFEEQVLRAPEAVAVIYERQTLTYAELNRRANQLAHYLRDQGIQFGECVPIFMVRSLRMLIAKLAVLKCGGAYVPIDPKLPAERQKFLFHDCAARYVLAEQSAGIDVDRGKVHWIDYSAVVGAIVSQAHENLGQQYWSTSPAYVMYTSGSTGVPKGVVIPHRAVNRLVINNGYAQIESQDCVAHCSNPAFDASTFEIWSALLNGARLLIVPQAVVLQPQRFAEVLTCQHVTVLWLTAGLFAQYTEVLQGVFDRLRYLLVGGDVVEPAAIRRVQLSGGPQHLLNGYGPTECTTFSTTYRIDSVEPGMTSIPIGRPISNTQVYILDGDLQPVPIGVSGEIYIGGDGVALGYLGRPALTAERFVANCFNTIQQTRMYRTGDLGSWRSDGTIEYLGRGDQQVKIRGFRIELTEIEARLASHNLVREAAVVIHENSPGDKQLVAYIVDDKSSAYNASSRRSSEKLQRSFLGNWETFWDDLHAHNPMYGPSFIGLDRTSTGRAIPEIQMQEWINHTIERLRGLRPERILELGCGTGLLIDALARDCEHYLGIDFSCIAIKRLQHWIGSRKEFEHVQLLCRSAAELHDIPTGSFDTVVLHSLVQYFPDPQYLLSVLQEAVRLLTRGGTIFVGDVKHLGLLPMLHNSAQLGEVMPEVKVDHLRKRVSFAVSREKELAIEPRFFHEVPKLLQGIGAVDIQLKRGSGSNELTRYRYDVMLHAGDELARRQVAQCVEWRTNIGSIVGLDSSLERGELVAARVTSIPNSRLIGDARALRLVESCDLNSEIRLIRSQLENQFSEGVDPEVFWRLGHKHGYDVRVSWPEGGAPETFEVELLSRARASEIDWKTLASERQLEPLERYIHSPLNVTFGQKVVPQIRDYLKEQLPEYMIPSAWVMLHEMPLTQNGKIDRRDLSLRELRKHTEDAGQYAEPCTDLERALADIWMQILKVDKVGIYDDFFELGGHSLHAAKLTLKVSERCGLELPAVSLLKYPTVEKMAKLVTSMRDANERQVLDSPHEYEEGFV